MTKEIALAPFNLAHPVGDMAFACAICVVFFLFFTFFNFNYFSTVT